MITIHCGLHKTGSSSIQLALSAYRGAARVMIPQPGDDQSDEAWARRLAAVAAVPEAVLSDEKLLGSAYDAYAAAEERVEMLRSAMAGRQFRIVVYLRPQPGWLTSTYLQGAQEGQQQGPDEFWHSISQEPFLRWSSLLDLLRGRSGASDVAVRAYGPGRDVVADFFAVAGLGSPPRVGPEGLRENVSISAVQAPVLRALCARPGVTASELGRIRDVFQRVLAQGAPRGLSPFPIGIQEQMREAFRDDWSAVAASLSSDPTDAAVLSGIEAGWAAEPLPFAGVSVDDPLVRDELLRSVQVLAVGAGPAPRSPTARMVHRVRRDPAGLPEAILRRIRRKGDAWPT